MDQIKNHFVVVLIAVFVTLMSIDCQKGRIHSSVRHPIDPKTKVITYHNMLGSEVALSIKSSGPDLIIHADGSVLIHDPYGYQKRDNSIPDHVSRLKSRISIAELNDLLLFIKKNDFYSMNSKTMYAKGIGKEVADANTISVNVVTATHKHKVWVYAPGFHRGKYMFVEVRKFKAISDRMRQLRARLIRNSERKRGPVCIGI